MLRSSKRPILLATVLRVLIAASVGLSLAAAADDPPKPVKLMRLDAPQAGNTRMFFGRVSAKESVELAFQVAGRLTTLPIVEGEIVDRGELIAQLDTEPFELALARARATSVQAERVLDRLERLRGSSATQSTIDEATTQSELAAVDVRDAEYALEQATLTAPFDALIARRITPNFSSVDAGTPVVRLHDMSELRVEIDVPEVLFQRVGKDPDLDIHARFPASEKLFPLAFRELDAEASSIGQTFKVTLGMTPPEELNLLPGSSVTVIVDRKVADGGFIVPASAIRKEADGTVSVMRFDAGDDGDGRLVRTPVRLSIDSGGQTRIVEGVEAGQQIVVAGIDVLEDGQAVSRFTAFGQGGR